MLSRIEDRLFLHDGEKLLCSLRSSPAVLVVSVLRGFVDAVIADLFLSGAAFALFYFAWGIVLSWYAYGLLFLFCYGIVSFMRWNVWRHASLRITTDRILSQTPTSLFHPHLTTIKWPQYQESFLGTRNILDFFFRSRPLCIRYGTADAHKRSCFPSVIYAQDLKHYLDKVDSAVRKNLTSELRPFVSKPRGKRDEM
jgi:hypothetical protein